MRFFFWGEESGWEQGVTARGGKVLGVGKTVEELGLEDWAEVVVVGWLRGRGFSSGGKSGVGGGCRWFRKVTK